MYVVHRVSARVLREHDAGGVGDEGLAVEVGVHSGIGSVGIERRRVDVFV